MDLLSHQTHNFGSIRPYFKWLYCSDWVDGCCRLAAKTGAGMEWKKGAGALGQLTTVHKFLAPLNKAGDYQHAEDAR